jgi:hypothetical protein
MGALQEWTNPLWSCRSLGVGSNHCHHEERGIFRQDGADEGNCCGLPASVSRQWGGAGTSSTTTRREEDSEATPGQTRLHLGGHGNDEPPLMNRPDRRGGLPAVYASMMAGRHIPSVLHLQPFFRNVINA